MRFSIKTISLFLNKKEIETKLFISIFYTVGIIGMLLPKTFPLFVQLIPFALILSSLLLAVFHTNGTSIKTAMVFLFIFLSSFIIETVGVNTGLLFGSYQYGNSLGFKVLQTPILIGLNWLILVYVTASVLEKFRIPPFLKITLASILMVVYDLVLEQVAPLLDMWSFKDQTVPLQNYLVWFGVSLFFHLVIKAFKINTHNKLAWIILASQFVFFLVLATFL